MSAMSARREIGVFAQRQADVFRQRHGTPQGAALKEHAESPQLLQPRLLAGLPERRAIVKHIALRRLLQADHVPQQGALAAAAAAHDDEDLAALDLRVNVAHHYKGPVGHRQVANLDLDVGVGAHGSNVQRVADHGKKAIRGDDRGDARHDGRGGGLADRGGVGAALHPAQTARSAPPPRRKRPPCKCPARTRTGVMALTVRLR